MTTRLLSATVTALLGLAGTAFAQDSTFQLRAVLNDPSQPAARFFVGKPGSLVPLNLMEEGLTESQEVSTENGNLNLFSSATVNQANPKASLAATVKIPVGPSSLIAIIVPAQKGSPAGTPPYRMVVLPDDEKSFPWGEGRAMNLTNVDFALEVGDQKILLPGGKITPVPKVTKVDDYHMAQTNFYYKQGNEWVIAAERPMQYMASMRRVFLIYKTPDALAPDVRTLTDRPIPVFNKPR